MTKPTYDVTDAELAVLRDLWDGGPSTIRELTDRIYPGGGTSSYATVQKLLDRLEGKGCVSREQAGRANVFSAKVERDELIARRLQETADKLCEGSLAPLLTQLVSGTRLTDEDLELLREVVARHREPRS